MRISVRPLEIIRQRVAIVEMVYVYLMPILKSSLWPAKTLQCVNDFSDKNLG